MPTPSSSYEGITPLPPSVVSIRAGIFQPPDEVGLSITVPTNYTLYTGSIAPVSGVGRNGDWYIFVDTTTLKTYRKIINVWTLVSTLAGGGGGNGTQGPPGPAGPAGPAGATGSIGNTGVTGPVGPTGPTGPQGPGGGDPGPPGADGPAGINGLDGSRVFYSVVSSPPVAPNIGDVWWVTDLAYEYRRWNGTIWATPAPNIVFEIVGGATYIKEAAIRQLSAGKIIAGDITVALTMNSLGSLSVGAGDNRFFTDSNGVVFGDTASGHIKVYGFNTDGSTSSGIELRSGLTQKGFLKFTGGVFNSSVLDLGGGASSAVQNVLRVSSGGVVQAFGTLNDHTIDVPIYSAGGGYFVGDVNAAGFITPSALRLKKNIRPIESALDKVLAMRGVRFDWKNVDEKDDIGFIAEEVDAVEPSLVERSHGQVMGIDYSRVTPLLVEAIKELYALRLQSK